MMVAQTTKALIPACAGIYGIFGLGFRAWEWLHGGIEGYLGVGVYQKWGTVLGAPVVW